MKNKDWYKAQIDLITQDNYGKPPGEARFYEKTNTKVSDWRDKPWNIWNNWGDVLEEFGYTRGKLQESFDKLDILRLLADLTKSLRRSPNQRDLRRAKKENPAFPTDSTIRKHFGEKDEVIRSLIEFCKDKPEFSQALEICTNSVSTAQEIPFPETSEGDESGKGYIYLVKGKDGYKVGMTTAPYHRIATILKSLPHGGELVHFFATDDRRGVEKYWQEIRWKNKRIPRLNAKDGEWFDLTANDVQAFKRRKKFM